MVYLWATVLTLANLAWLATVLLGLPGNWLMLISAVLVNWLLTPNGDMFSWPVLAVAAVLALVGEGIEFFAGVEGSRRFGGTKRGAVGALIGSIVGGIIATFTIPLPVIGSLIGACAGAGLGAWGFELWGGQKMRPALNSGFGAGLGRLGGTLGKIGCGVVMWLLLAVAAFWP